MPVQLLFCFGKLAISKVPMCPLNVRQVAFKKWMMGTVFILFPFDFCCEGTFIINWGIVLQLVDALPISLLPLPNPPHKPVATRHLLSKGGIRWPNI